MIILTNSILTYPLYVHLVGWLAACLSMAAFIPQAIKTVKTRETKAISFSTFIIYCVTNGFWVLWAALDWAKGGSWFADLNVIIPNVVCTLIIFVILKIKWENKKKYLAGIKNVENEKTKINESPK